MKLSELLAYDNIVIQCHNNPDADTIACGFGVYLYLKSKGKEPRLIYGGQNVIRKTNLVMLIRDLKIPIEHVDYLHKPELLVMVDCQYHSGNSAVFEAEHIAVIDHHRICTELPELSEVRSNLGACSTLVWNMLKTEGFDVRGNRELSTALYYGLYTDTGSLTEIVHPLDRDLRDEANFDPAIMRKLRNANLSLEELEVAGAALLHTDYVEEFRAAIVKVGQCDPNILGLISDLVLEVDAIDICVAFNLQPEGVKFSVRSCVKEVKASELAAELCKGIGSGGGHLEKAGGLIPMELMTQEYLKFCKEHHFAPRMGYDAQGRHEQPAASGIKSVIEQRMRDYMGNTDIVYAQDCRIEAEDVKTYCRRSVPWGYVRATDLFAEGTQVTVRTLQGDMKATVEAGIVFIIGPKGECFFRNEEAFMEEFRIYTDWKFDLRNAEYEPTIKDVEKGIIVEPMKCAKVCVPKGTTIVRARRLERKVKLFRDKDENEQYTLGRVGDYMVDSSDTINNIRIMRKDLFEEIYRDSGEQEEQKSVIFDLDGTLLYSLEDLKNATNAALESQNMPTCTLDQVRRYVGNGVRMLMVRAVPDGEKNPKFEETFAEFKKYYGEHCLDHTKPYPDIMHLLTELKVRGVKTAIVSNKLDSAVKELDERFFRGYMTTAIGEMEGVAKKPAPDMVQKAMKILKTDTKKAIYVGDSEVDIQTAENTGLPCVSVMWGFRDAEFLRKNRAQVLIQRPLELLYLI